MRRRKIRSYLVVLLIVSLHSPALFAQSRSSNVNSKSKTTQVLCGDDAALPFKTWLAQDVAWIITPAEKAAFNELKNGEQCDQFVEAFWSRRDPTPDTYENEFKEEHYRRIAYANDHFGGQDPGWKTDRGRIYIVYGPPDRITTYSAQDSRPKGQDGQDYKGLPGETWSYRYLEGVGMDVVIDFVDICSCGNYQMRMPDEGRDALLYIPDVGVIDGKLEKTNLDLYLKGVLSPTLKFRDLAARLDSIYKERAIPLEVNTEISKATDVTSIVKITISFPRQKAATPEAESAPSATVNVVGRLKAMTGHVVELFEAEATVSQSSPSDIRVQKSIPLLNARYRLELAAEIAHTEEATTWTGMLNVRP